MLPTKWLQRLHDARIRLCHNTACHAEHDELRFVRDWAYLNPGTKHVPRNIIINCEKNIKRYVYFLKRRYGPPVEVTVDQYFNVNISQWAEGLYWLFCDEHTLKIYSGFPRAIFDKGHFEQDCSGAPDVIYLEDERKEYQLCQWKAVVPSFWEGVARVLQPLQASLRCHSIPPGLNFEQGLLRTGARDMMQGFIKVFCYPGRFQKTLIIASSPQEFTIHLSPKAFIINNTHSGKLSAAVGRFADGERVNAYLTARFPVTCAVTYTSQKPGFVWLFTGQTPFAALFSGMARIVCNQTEMRLQQVFNRIVVTGPDGRPPCEPPNVIKLEKNRTSYPRCPPLDMSDRPIAGVQLPPDVQCLDLHKQYRFVEGSLVITIAPVEPDLVPFLCTPGLQNKSILIHDPNDLRLEIIGQEAQSVFDDEGHKYVCVLTGPIDSMLGSEVNKPRWRSLWFRTRVTIMGNEIRVDKEASLGEHSYECFYHRPWISLRQPFQFKVSQKSQIKLIIKYEGKEKQYYLPKEELPKIFCHLHGGKMTEEDSIRWSLLHGDVPYRLTIIGMRHQLELDNGGPTESTFRCSTVGQSKCLSKIILLRIINGEATFEISETDNIGPLAFVSCQFTSRYLGIDTESGTKIAAYDISGELQN
ncbi:unnamed protein product [Echinostoma caproni]|uniref:Ig-like domain-containing protein n=1 Tax=Echinostoma caproni TaxID=27848 RepID=A0A183ANY3_9TREM|nr:unnamed protein product [Echinostoma caproni]